MKQFARWMSFASVAKGVYDIGPKSSPYWLQWEAYFAETTTLQAFITGVDWVFEMPIQNQLQSDTPGSLLPDHWLPLFATAVIAILMSFISE